MAETTGISWADNTSIEWTEDTWNPIRARDSAGTVGWHCERVSPGCQPLAEIGAGDA